MTLWLRPRSSIIKRAFGLQKAYLNPARSSVLLEFAQKLVPETEVCDFSFALLDFFAVICKAKNPNCSSCPLKEECNHAIAESGPTRVA